MRKTNSANRMPISVHLIDLPHSRDETEAEMQFIPEPETILKSFYEFTNTIKRRTNSLNRYIMRKVFFAAFVENVVKLAFK